MKHHNITFIGGGNMGKSLIKGIINAGYPTEKITVSTPFAEEVAKLKETFGINGTTSNPEAAKEADIVVMAVKPQMMHDVLTEFSGSGIDFSNKLIISIMAGVTTFRISELVPGLTRIVRVMPNTPALIGLGMAGLYPAAGATEDDRVFAEELLSCCGKTVWVQSEEGIDNITALSGSAPAYFFLFMECMAEKAKEYGFSEEQARTILEQVALGSAQMVIKNQDKTIAELREAVTSKGGTTYEALKVFNESNLMETVSKALDACKNRAEEMSKQF